MTKNRFEIVKSKLIKDGWVISDKLKQFTFPTLRGDKRALVSYCKALNELHEENQAVKDVLNDLNSIDSYWDSALLQEYILKIANILGVDLE